MRRSALIPLSTAVLLLVAFSASALPRGLAAQTPCQSPANGFCVRLEDDLIAPPGTQSGGLWQRAQIVGAEFLEVETTDTRYIVGDIVVAIYKFGTILVILAAVVVSVYGGILYMVGKAADGKKYLTSGVYGVILVLVSWLILYTINPNLVQKLELDLTPIGEPKPPPSGGRQDTGGSRPDRGPEQLAP